MIKLKHLIKEETIHSCDCGGDCCSVNESKGMELGKIFTGHGFAFKKESLKGGSLPNKEKDFRKIKKVKDEPDSQKGSSDSTDTFSKHHAGSMGSGDMGRIAEPDTYDWDDSGSEPNKAGHQTKKNKKKKGYEPVEMIEGFEKYHLGNLLDSKLKKRLERAIKLWGGKIDAVGMDTIKFRLSSSDVKKLPLLLKKLDQNKNVWIGDKRKKNIWDRKRKIDKLESCGYTMSAEPPHKKLKSSGGTGPEDREFKENLIYVDKDMKDGKFDPKNPQVHIQGYGVVNLKNLQDSLSRKFIELAKRAKKGDFGNIQHHLEKNSVVVGFVEAGVDANKQLKTSQMKRKITMYKQKRYK